MKKQKTWLVCAALFLLAASSSAQDPASIPYFSIISPNYLINLYEQGDGNYSTALFGVGVENGNVVGEVKSPDADSFFCTSDGTSFAGKIAMIDRGSCIFKLKVANAEAAGAIGVIIINFDNTVPNMADGDPNLPNPTIPVVMVTKTIGDAIKQAMAQGETVAVALSVAPLNFGLIEGDVRRDDNDNCIGEAGEMPLHSWFVVAQGVSGAVTIRSTDNTGHYKIFADTTDSPYSVFVVPPNQAWAPCPASTTVTLATPDTVQADFTAQVDFECVELQADISVPFLRRCFENYFSANVCNNGTATAEDAYADVTMSPEFDPITNASLPFTTLSADVYRFQLGDMGAGECVNITFRAVVNCDSTELGQTLCYSVHAFPDTTCIQPSTAWSGANVSVTGACEGDSVRLTITNVGSGDMDLPREYVIIEDDVMRGEGQFQLGAGQSQTFKQPANGSTWRLEAAQEPEHPFPGVPAATVEACTQGSNFSTGFYLMYPLYDAAFAIDEECQEVIGAYDPNDKQGFPRGFGPDHLVRPNTALDYLIRFQNTGTDTAFTVVVRDTLPAVLDAMSIRLGAASHAYTYEKTEQNVLIFRFNNIRLVDSFTNEPASHGFLTFKIDQKPDLPFGTLIQNSAAIFFDFNPPVITNETQHEVGYVLGVLSFAKEPENAAVVPVVFPNPAISGAVLQVRGNELENADWRLFELSGRQLAAGQLDGVQLKLPQIDLPKGVLLLEVRTSAGQAYFVKLMSH